MSAHPGERWSYGGATTVETAEGLLLPEALLIGPRHAAMDARWRAVSAAADPAFHQAPGFDDVFAVDDRGARCGLRVEAISAGSEPSGEDGWPTALRLALDPVPGRAARWLELHGRDGTMTRLLPSARAVVQVGPLTPAATSPAGQDPPEYASFAAAAAGCRDGPRRQLDLGAALPPIDGVTVLVDSLFSWPGSWRLYLRAMPGWWKYSQDRSRKWSPISVNAEDDRGGTYLGEFGGATGHRDHEEFSLRFLPCLNPLARALTLTFRGASEEIPVVVGLETAVTEVWP